MEGYGIVFFAFGGNIYGAFHKNKVHGPGILKFPNGDIWAARWDMGRLVGKCLKFEALSQNWQYINYQNGITLKIHNEPTGLRSLTIN